MALNYMQMLTLAGQLIHTVARARPCSKGTVITHATMLLLQHKGGTHSRSNDISGGY